MSEKKAQGRGWMQGKTTTAHAIWTIRSKTAPGNEGEGRFVHPSSGGSRRHSPFGRKEGGRGTFQAVSALALASRPPSRWQGAETRARSLFRLVKIWGLANLHCCCWPWRPRRSLWPRRRPGSALQWFPTRHFLHFLFKQSLQARGPPRPPPAEQAGKPRERIRRQRYAGIVRGGRQRRTRRTVLAKRKKKGEM